MFIVESPSDAVQNLKKLIATFTNITISWEKPISTGHPEYYYSITYENEVEKPITAANKLVDIRDIVTYTVTNLSHSTAYVIHVTTHNGVSNQDPNIVCRTRYVLATTLERRK